MTKDDGTVVQEEQIREIVRRSIDGAIEKVDDHTVKLNLPIVRHHHHPELRATIRR